jgi:hypothetical protein
LLEVEDGWLEIYYGPLRLGWLDASHQRFKPEPSLRRRRANSHRLGAAPATP